MTPLTDPDPFVEPLSFIDDADASFDEWTLDELDRSADLASIRFAGLRADVAIE